jgi:thiol:disulfide interchange protein DsbD
MALLVGATGAQTIAANPWINLFIGTVFVVFALSLLGLFELRLPHRFVNYVNRQGNQKQGWIGVLFMGFTLTLVSFSCTAPFVGGLLAATADNEFTWPILGMVAFSTTFALPFIFFALFPGWLSSLPSSGAWMNVVKVTLGFVELAAAFKFLSNADLIWEWGIISRTMVVALWIVIFFLTGVYLLGKLHLAHDEPVQKIGTVRLMFAMGFLGFALYLIPGLLGAPLNNVDAYLPPRQATDVSLIAALPQVRTAGSIVHADLTWFSSDTMPYQEAMDQAFAEAKVTQRPVFIDFTGYTCTNCRHMESTVFARSEIIDRFRDNFVLLQLYTDDRTAGAALSKYQLQLTGTAALPTYVVTDPDGELLTRWEGVASVEDFMAFLDQGQTQYQQNNLASLSDP